MMFSSAYSAVRTRATALAQMVLPQVEVAPPALRRMSLWTGTLVTVAQEVDMWFSPRYTHTVDPLPDTELLVNNAAPVGIRPCILRGGADVPGIKVCSLASTSHSKIFITPFRSQLPLVVSRLMMSRISDGSLFTRRDVRSPPYVSTGIPEA